MFAFASTSRPSLKSFQPLVAKSPSSGRSHFPVSRFHNCSPSSRSAFGKDSIERSRSGLLFELLESVNSPLIADERRPIEIEMCILRIGRTASENTQRTFRQLKRDQTVRLRPSSLIPLFVFSARAGKRDPHFVTSQENVPKGSRLGILKLFTITQRDEDPYLSPDGVGQQDGRRTFVVPPQLRGLNPSLHLSQKCGGQRSRTPGGASGPLLFLGQEDLTLYGVPKQ